MAPKSGKERRAKRNARKQTEKELPAHWVPTTKKEEQENNRLIQQSTRWNTEATRQSFSNRKPSELTAKELALLVTRRNMLSPDPEISVKAVKNLILMEQQNQKDDQPKPVNNTPEEHNHLHLHNTQFKNASDADVIEAANLITRMKR